MQSQASANQDIKPCPICGRVPRAVSGLFGGCYLQCDGHVETRIAATNEEAVRLWNNGEYET